MPARVVHDDAGALGQLAAARGARAGQRALVAARSMVPLRTLLLLLAAICSLFLLAPAAASTFTPSKCPKDMILIRGNCSCLSLVVKIAPI
ncbi:hypothetical protein MSG28_006209 [Choristoneura fumiferana]|uniref:Uncharacterized protein n=1 Tax=Choristoneura fumiferana TaxID=7141 RepID=A0ACC0JDY8_CHOFU|nr:hypothetical protein MSG28_006209 [Choristoneura fumiferana]